MKKRPVDQGRTIPAYDQTAEVSEPSESALDFPASPVASERATVLRGCANTVAPVRSNQFGAVPPQVTPHLVAVISFISDQSLGVAPGSAALRPVRDADRGERLFDQRDLRRGRRVQVVSQRKTLAVDHHHPLRALSPLGFADFFAPFFAGAKLPSRNASLQSSCRRWSSCPRKARQISSHTPCCSQALSRRQQVEGDGYFSGRSCQRAPLRRIQRIPSSTGRSGAQGRPPLRCALRLGTSGAILAHCSSVNSGPLRATGPPLGPVVQHSPNICSTKCLACIRL